MTEKITKEEWELIEEHRKKKIEQPKSEPQLKTEKLEIRKDDTTTTEELTKEELLLDEKIIQQSDTTKKEQEEKDLCGECNAEVIKNAKNCPNGHQLVWS